MATPHGVVRVPRQEGWTNPLAFFNNGLPYLEGPPGGHSIGVMTSNFAIVDGLHLGGGPFSALAILELGFSHLPVCGT